MMEGGVHQKGHPLSSHIDSENVPMLKKSWLQLFCNMCMCKSWGVGLAFWLRTGRSQIRYMQLISIILLQSAPFHVPS